MSRDCLEKFTEPKLIRFSWLQNFWLIYLLKKQLKIDFDIDILTLLFFYLFILMSQLLKCALGLALVAFVMYLDRLDNKMGHLAGFNL